MFSFTLITVFNVKFELAIWTNIVIAIATCVATAIHIDNQIKLRKNRAWEINKNILLELSSALAKVIKDLKKANDYYFDEMQGILKETGAKYTHPKKLYVNFSQKTFEVLNVYKPLMNKDLIDALKHMESVEKNILNGMDDGKINVYEAYDISLDEHQKLQEKLNTFIRKIAGVEYT